MNKDKQVEEKHKHGWVLSNDSSPNQLICLDCREVRAIPECKHEWYDLGTQTDHGLLVHISCCKKCRSLSGRTEEPVIKTSYD